MTTKVVGGTEGDAAPSPAPGVPSERTAVLGSGSPAPVSASALPRLAALPQRPVAGLRTRERAIAGPPASAQMPAVASGSKPGSARAVLERPQPQPQRRAPSVDGTQVLGDDYAPGAALDSPETELAPPPAAPGENTRAKRKRPESRHPLSFEDTQRIDRFELIREIARGGMGQVFLARDTKLGRKVAIKFLLHDDPNFVSRFIVEARATARCTHENIVTIFEVGEHLGLPFMVLEYLEGKTLSQLFEAQRPSPRQFVELMIPVVRALERAHEHGIVHRDLKPSNIFVTDRGSVKVLDFGVAKCFDTPGEPMDHIASAAIDGIEPNSEHTYVTFSGNGSLVGTLPYMSPEQWGADTVDFASDVWAVGIMFWRALTSVHPAGTMAPDRMRERMLDLDTPLPSLHVRDPSIPRELSVIVDCCLAKRKSARYPSASALVEDLQAFLAPKEVRAEDVSPYRGLAAFAEGDAKFFFGRSAEVRTAVAQLDFWPLLAVIGPSGVGKSSFVHAGLVPAVRATGGNWQTRVLRPGRAPLTSLANVLHDDAVDAGQIHDIITHLDDAPGMFGEALRREAAKKRQRLLIVVDQLEELFTLSDDDGVRRQFLAALLAAADDPSSPVRVVLSMRADFLDRLATHKHFLAELSRGLFFLSAPDADNLRETLVRPAELAGYHFEDDAILDDMMQKANSRGALPLLQFAAQKLWDSRDRARKLLTRAAYDAMGGVGGAFARHADEVAAAVPAHSQQLLRAIMTRLVTLERTRAVVDHAELLGLGDDRAEIERIIDQLVRARLILLHTDPTAGQTVEIVHEVLITEWPTLVRWLEDTQSLQGFMHELRQAARQWHARGRSSDLVWRGATAQEALVIASRHVLDLTATERDFILAVRQQAARGKRRRVMSLAAAFILLGLVIAGGAVAFIRISAAEKRAQTDADGAREAKGQVAKQLHDLQDAQAKRDEADRVAESERQKALTAEGAVASTKEDLVRANADLKNALDEAKHAVDDAKKSADEAKVEKLKAQDLAKTAAVKADEARKAQQQAQEQAKENARLLAIQRAENEKLENNRKGIANTLKP